MNKVGWIIFGAIVVLLLGGLIAWARITNPPIDVSNVNNNSVITASEDNGNIGDHVKGSDTKKIILVEYGDYQCPSCGGAYPNLNTLMDEYGDSVTFVFRNFPLTSIHPNARAAAAVAESAGLQGKFWEMYDLLFQNQNDWSGASADQRTTIFNGYASSLQLDMDKFTQDLTSQNVTKKISFDMAVGKQAGASATPTFYLNGEELDNEAASGIVKGDLSAIRAKLDALVDAQ